jgi:hypothetical protein
LAVTTKLFQMNGIVEQLAVVLQADEVDGPLREAA